MGKVTHSRRVGLALSALLVIFTFTCWCCGTNESSGCKRPIEPSQGLCEGEMGRCSASRRKVTFDYSQNLVFEQTWCSAYWIVCFQNSETRNYVQLLNCHDDFCAISGEILPGWCAIRSQVSAKSFSPPPPIAGGVLPLPEARVTPA